MEWIAAAFRHHITPLALLELTVFGVALVLGFKTIALVVLAFHIGRMVASVGAAPAGADAASRRC